MRGLDYRGCWCKTQPNFHLASPNASSDHRSFGFPSPKSVIPCLSIGSLIGQREEILPISDPAVGAGLPGSNAGSQFANQLNQFSLLSG